MEILLASASPRRRELIANLDIPFVCASVDVDERVDQAFSPDQAAVSVAAKKAQAALTLPESAGRLIVSADTMVVCGGEIFGKPVDKADAYRMLSALSGRVHEVITGVCLIAPDGRSLSFCERSQVCFYPLSDSDIKGYIATGEPMDKAGAYGIQGKGMLLVREIKGDYFNIVGLPVAKLKRMIDMLIG